jgi:hypothetical protein
MYLEHSLIQTCIFQRLFSVCTSVLHETEEDQNDGASGLDSGLIDPFHSVFGGSGFVVFGGSDLWRIHLNWDLLLVSH